MNPVDPSDNEYSPLQLAVIMAAVGLPVLYGATLVPSAGALSVLGVFASLTVWRLRLVPLGAVAAGVAAAMDPMALIAWPGFALLAGRHSRAAVGKFSVLASASFLCGATLRWPFPAVDSVRAAAVGLLAADDHVGIFSAFGANGRSLLEALSILPLALLGLAVVLFYIARRLRRPRDAVPSAGVRCLAASTLTLALVCFAPGLDLTAGLYALPAFALGAAMCRPVALPLCLYSVILLIDFYLMSHARLELYAAVPAAKAWMTPHRLTSWLWKVGILAASAVAMRTPSTGADTPIKSPFRWRALWAASPPRAARLVQAASEALGKLDRPFSLTKLDLSLLGGILVGCLSLNLVKIGRRDLPETGLAVGLHQQTVQLHKSDKVKAVYFFVGEGEVALTVACRDTGETASSAVAQGDLMRWQVASLDRPCDSSLELMAAIGPGGSLREIKLGSPRYASVVPASVCNDQGCVQPEASPLFDELTDLASIPSFGDGAIMDEKFNIGPGVRVLTGSGRETTPSTVHPFLARGLIMASMGAFGMSPFAWRLPSALLGAMIPIILFFLARELAFRRSLAWLACMLAVFETGRLVLSRTAFVDAQGTGYILLSYVFLVRYVRGRLGFSLPNEGRSEGQSRTSPWAILLAGLAFGAAVAAKWTGLFAFPLIAAAGFLAVAAASRASLGGGLGEAGRWGVCFALLPAVIYGAAYLPFFAVDGIADFAQTLIKHQVHIFTTHAGVGIHKTGVNAHVFAARFPSWLFSEVTLPIFRMNLADRIAAVHLMTHPLLSLAILPALALILKRRSLRRHPGVVIATMIFLCHFLAWSLIRRETFNYHFLTASMVSVLLVATAVQGLRRRWTHAPVVFLSAYLAVFCLLTPTVYGVSMARDYYAKAKIFDSWFNRVTIPARDPVRHAHRMP